MSKVSSFDNFGVEDMGKEEYAEKMAYVVQNCKCEGCPTYVKGDEKPGFCFPVIGTSSAIHHEESCLCSSCPIYEEYELSHTFYCTRCSQLCQTHKVEDAGGHE